MPTFQFQALNADGTPTGGLVFGTSMGMAMEDLAKRGLTVQSISVAQTNNDPIAARAAVSAPVYNGVPATAPDPGYVRDYQSGPGIPGVVDSEHDVRTRMAEVPGGYREGVQPPGAREVFGERLGNPTSQIMGPSTEQRSYVATSVVGPLVGKVSLTNLSFFFSQLATMLDAGVPLVQALDTLSTQQRDPKFKTILREMKGHVEAGRPISAGMQRYPEVFSPVMLSLVRSGEEGGFLDDALKTTAEYLEREIELNNLYRRVTFYPKLQIAASMLIIIGANAIISSIKPGAQGLSSPLTTWTTWIWLGPLIIAAFLFARVGLANFQVKYMWDTFVSNVPYLGPTLRQIAMARFGRAFGALYKSGVPMSRALTLGADACGNEFLRARIYPAQQALERGEGVTETLKSTHAFSPIVMDMVGTGEKTGNLDQMLGKMSEYYEQESHTRSIQLGQVFGVLVGLGVAIYIGFIIISFWSGYGQSTQDMINNGPTEGGATQQIPALNPQKGIKEELKSEP